VLGHLTAIKITRHKGHDSVDCHAKVVTDLVGDGDKLG